jgi:catalase
MANRLARDLVAAFDAIFGGPHQSRAAHAKGTCCRGVFVATPEAATLTTAPHLQGQPVEVTVRFSNGSGDPHAHDAGREPRGMSVKFHLDDGTATDIVSINQPVFIVRTPEDFLEFMQLRRPDPETGQINLEALMAFVAARPEAVQAANILLGAQRIASFLQADYFAVHAFMFVGPDGTARAGRYRWESALGTATVTKEEAKDRGPDYLREDLRERLRSGPAIFTLHIQLAADADDPSDPTTEWPPDRESVVAGQLEITGPVDDQDRGCERFIFDPMRLCDGIEPSGDLILQTRRPAYAVSATRRLDALE